MTTTLDELEKAIREKRGNLAAVGRKFGITRQAVSKRVRENDVLKEAYDEAKESMLDAAEDSLYDMALNGNVAALIFLLKTQGKGRGYVERNEVVGADDAPPVQKVVFLEQVPSKNGSSRI